MERTKDFIKYNEIDFYFTSAPLHWEREMHTYHEILFYIDGDVTFLTESGKRQLVPNTLILIPRGKFHFCRTQKEGFSRLKINVPAAVVEELSLENLFSELVILEDLNESISFVLKRLCQLMECEPTQKTPVHAYGALLMLLAELDQIDLGLGKKFAPKSEGMRNIISYISENLAGNLSVETLARETNHSASKITHTFKKEMGISLHEYVTQRRLMYAKSLLLSKNRPTQIYSECGFQDYSSFYKAFTKFYGYPPSKEK